VLTSASAALRQVRTVVVQAAAGAEAFEIAPVLTRFQMEEHVEAAATRRLWRELVRFLMMVAHAGEQGYGMHGPADKLWHHFVLHTEPYQAFCDRHAGRFLHHHPGTSQQGSTWQAGYLRFLVDYRTVFGEAPPDDIWPLPAVRGAKLPKSAAQLRPRHVKAVAELEHGLRHRKGGRSYSQEGFAGCGTSGGGGQGTGGDDPGGGDGGGCGGGCSGR